MDWTNIWMKLFGTSALWGVDMGFWVGMSAVVLIVVVMNLVFWGIKSPKQIDGLAEKEEIQE